MAFASQQGATDVDKAFDAHARRLFLDHLAMTANVAASARAAGVSSTMAYRYRRRYPEFARAWQAALAEGFSKLESDLLAEALTAVSGKISDAALKSRAQKHRLGLALLSLHRAAVKGEAPAPAPLVAAVEAETAAKVRAKLLDLYDRRAAAAAQMSTDEKRSDGPRQG